MMKTTISRVNRRWDRTTTRHWAMHSIRCFVMIILVLSAAAFVAGSAMEDKQVGGRSVSATFVTSNGLAPEATPEGRFRIVVSTVSVRPNDSIFDLLTNNGIEPDVEAFTLVYDLNPSLNSVDPLLAGSRLLLPQVIGSKAPLGKLKANQLVMLTIDRSIRDELNMNAVRLQQLSGSFAQLPTGRFPNLETKQQVTHYVKALALWFAHIRQSFLQRTGPPLRRATLVEMRDESQALTSMLEQILDHDLSVTNADNDQITRVHKDIAHEIRRYDEIMAGEPPRADPTCEVRVEIQGADADRVRSLRVYYTLEGLYRRPPKTPIISYPSNDLGSGKTIALNDKDYMIWAAKDGEPSPSLTQEHPLSVQARPNCRPTRVELSLSQ